MQARSCVTSKAENRPCHISTSALFGLASIFRGYTTGRAVRPLIRSAGTVEPASQTGKSDGSRWPINAAQGRRLVALIA